MQCSNAFRTLILTFFLSGLSAATAKAQAITLAGGLSFSYAPSIEYGTRQGAANFLTFFGDLQINRTLIGRLEFSSLLGHGLNTDNIFEPDIERGYALHGGLGYNFVFGSQGKIELPLILAAGYGQVTLDNTVADGGLQLGVIISPRYRITDWLGLELSIRSFRGSSNDDMATPISFTDVGAGLRIELF